MSDYSQYTANYLCPKCKGRTCLTSETIIGGLTHRLLTRPRDNRFLIVTCSLCGYSEFYSLQVLASGVSKETAKDATPAVENVE